MCPARRAVLLEEFARCLAELGERVRIYFVYRFEKRTSERAQKLLGTARPDQRIRCRVRYGEVLNLKGEDLNLTVREMSQEHSVVIVKDENTFDRVRVGSRVRVLQITRV